MAWGDSWGVQPDETNLSFPCDVLLSESAQSWFRGVTVEASSETVYRWLCQLRVAPYSYDWIDNWGRTSPRRLTEGAELLSVGQSVMTIFEIVSFEQGRHLTIQLKDTEVFPPIAITYMTVPNGTAQTRLLVKVRVEYGGLADALLSPWFARADLFMMKKQLRTLKALSEGRLGAVPERQPLAT